MPTPREEVPLSLIAIHWCLMSNWSVFHFQKERFDFKIVLLLGARFQIYDTWSRKVNILSIQPVYSYSLCWTFSQDITKGKTLKENGEAKHFMCIIQRRFMCTWRRFMCTQHRFPHIYVNSHTTLMNNNDNTALMMKVNEDNVCLDLEISNVDMEAQKLSKNQWQAFDFDPNFWPHLPQTCRSQVNLEVCSL